MVHFHDSVPARRKKTFYVRSAYRNDPEFQIGALQQLGDPLEAASIQHFIDNDAAVSRNYQRLVGQAIKDLWGNKERQTTFEEYEAKSIGEIRKPLRQLFPDLYLDNLGDPLEDGTFHFTKGISEGFVYKNLSGGEKAAFDLILDLVIARRHYNDTIFCIDEPESHMHTGLHAELLSVLYELVPESCQLMLATHSIGMMRRARDIEDANPESVVFLDFGSRNFDESQVIEPAKPNRKYWRKAYEVSLGDLSDLVAPSRVVICEGEPKTNRHSKNHSHDARCYERIFEENFPRN